MKNNITLFSCSLIAALVCFASCKKDSNLSSIPAIEYKGFSKNKTQNGKDSFVTLNLTFEDGDGDIGLSDTDSIPPYRFGSAFFNNLFIDFYSIENGVGNKIRSRFLADTLTKDTVNFHQRIKNITPAGVNKSIKGKIDVLIPFLVTLDLSVTKPDSIFFEIILFDRKLNQSQRITTPVIVVDL